MSHEGLYEADRRKVAGARELGKALLGRIRGVGSGAMGKGAMVGHVRAAQRAAVGDFHRIADSPAARGRTDALTKAADILDQAAQVERLPSGPVKSALVKRLEAAADGLSGPAVRNRNAARHSAAQSPFESQELDNSDGFRESRGDPDAFRSSGRVSEPACPMERLFGPPQNAGTMNWPGTDSEPPRHERRDGIDYDPASPAKGALTSLVAVAKRQWGSSDSTLRKSLDVAFDHRQALGEALYRDYTAMRSHLADARRPEDWRRSDTYRELVGRIERAPVSRLVKAELLSALSK